MAKEIKRINIEDIQNPDFLKDLSYKEIDFLCEDIRKYIVENVAKNGGHLSSNLGVVEATVALCKTFDFTKDKIIFDVGHQCYTYKVLTGRKLDKLRQKNGISGFQKMNESPFDHYEAGHSSTSISAANGLAVARDLKGEKYDIIAFIGDSSIINGVAVEGLNNLNTNGHKHKVIIVLNDNEMSISQPVGGVSNAFRKFSNSILYNRGRDAYSRIMNKTRVGRKIYSGTAAIKNWIKRHVMQMTIFDNLGYSVIGPVDGHNVRKVEKALSKARKLKKSCIVYLKTEKGRGYKFSENDEKGIWHGVGKFEPDTGLIYKDENIRSWSKHYSNILLDEMKTHENMYALVPGTSLGSALDKVLATYPDRSADMGINEEHLVVFAAGLAVGGYHPVISMYSTFLQRSYDEISHDLARMNLNCTIFVDRAGLVGQDGNTHQGIYDEAFLYSIPNTVITMATKPEQSRSLLTESLNKHGVFAIRFPRGGFLKGEPNREVVNFGEWIVNPSKSNKTAIISVGPNTEELASLIKEKGLDVTLVKAIYLKPINVDVLKSLLDYKTIIIYDAYATVNGFASYVASKLLWLGYKGNVVLKAIPDTFVDQASVKEQEKMFGLLPEQIIDLL